MNPANVSKPSLAIFAIIFLLGFGFVVYAFPGAGGSPLASSSTTSTSSSSSTSGVIYLKLIPVTSTAEGAKDSNATGYAGILVDPGAVALEWSISGAAPGQELEVVVDAVASTSTGSSTTVDLQSVYVSSVGDAGYTATVSLVAGYYSFGLTIIDPSSGATLFTTDPTSAQISVPPATTSTTSSTYTSTSTSTTSSSSTRSTSTSTSTSTSSTTSTSHSSTTSTQSSTSTTSSTSTSGTHSTTTSSTTSTASSTATTSPPTSTSFSYTLVPLPVYEGQTPPSGYPFQDGGAQIITSGDTLQVTSSFVGSPETEFYTVVQTTSENYTVGSVTSTTIGSGVYKGYITLAAGTYQMGVLIFVGGDSATPVAVSDPRAITVTLPVTSTTSSTSTSTTETKSSSTTSTQDTSTATTSETHSTTTSSTASTTSSYTGSSTTTSSASATSTSTPTVPPQAVDHLEFYPIQSVVAPTGYLFGVGGGEYAVTGGYITFSLAFLGQNPTARYSLVLSVNGSTRTIGNYTTDSSGAATTSASAYLGTGFFVLTLYVLDLASFKVPTAVLVTIPTEFDVQARVTSTTSTTSTSSASSQHSSATSSETSTPPATATSTISGPSWSFKLQDVYIPNLPRGYSYASSGTVTVTLNPAYSLLTVVVGFSGANPSGTYNAALVLNGSNTNLGTMTTNKNGGTELHSSIQVPPGKYFMGVAIYDVSDIGAFNASGPVLVMLSDPETQFIAIPGSASSSISSSQSSSSQSLATTTVTTSVTTLSAGSKVEQQIQTALENLTIPAVVQISPSTSSDTVYDSRFSLSVGQFQSNGVVIAISGENVTGPRVLLINMSRSAPLALYPALNITLDGFPVTEASSAVQVLNPSASNPPYYVLVGTSDSIQILVSIPHFSVHLLQIAGEVVHVVQTAVEVDSPLLVGSMVVVTIAFAVAYLTRKRYTPSPL